MYHYDTCGLEHVYLLNGFEEIETEQGRAVSIRDVDGLHRAIAESIVNAPRPLTGEELRFLRIEMDFSQNALGSLLDNKSDQTVANWEKGRGPIPKLVDSTIRHIYLESAGKHSQLRQLLDKFNQLDRDIQQREMTFEDTEDGWISSAA